MGYLTTVPSNLELVEQGGSESDEDYLNRVQGLSVANPDKLFIFEGVSDSGSLPSNMVTTDTAQLITGKKTFGYSETVGTIIDGYNILVKLGDFSSMDLTPSGIAYIGPNYLQINSSTELVGGNATTAVSGIRGKLVLTNQNTGKIPNTLLDLNNFITTDDLVNQAVTRGKLANDIITITTAAYVAGDGTITSRRGALVTVERIAVGSYRITGFENPFAIPMITLIGGGSAGRTVSVWNINTGQFDITIRDASNSNVDSGFLIYITN
jgi:hypothetical protein